MRALIVPTVFAPLAFMALSGPANAEAIATVYSPAVRSSLAMVGHQNFSM